MLEDRFAEGAGQLVGDTYVDPTANYTMSPKDYRVRPSNASGGGITITLPPVAEAKGRLYSILVRDADTFNTVTIADNNDDSERWGGDIALNSPGDRMVLYSDGLAWYPFLSGVGQWPGVATTAAPPTTAAPTT